MGVKLPLFPRSHFFFFFLIKNYFSLSPGSVVLFVRESLACTEHLEAQGGGEHICGLSLAPRNGAP